MRLLTTMNPKLLRSSGNYLPAILHLKPSKTICPAASKECLKVCLNTAGRGVMSPVQKARQRKTNAFKRNRVKFIESLAADIEKLIKRANKLNKTPVVRLNGTSDQYWSEVYAMFPDVQFWEYTKRRELITINQATNVHYTYSFSGSNKLDCLDLLSQGINVAVVFSGGLPETLWGYPVINGDDTDFRFLDPVGVIVGLKAKGKARKTNNDFIVEGE